MKLFKLGQIIEEREARLEDLNLNQKEEYYQYTAIDECSRLKYIWLINAQYTYTSSEFVSRLLKYFPFKIKTIQTDNGFELNIK